MTGNIFVRRSLIPAGAFAAAALFGGCVNYTQSELAPLSAVDICELEYMQRPNLTPAAKQAIQAELERRNDNCRNHAAEVARRYDEFMERETYGKLDSPS